MMKTGGFLRHILLVIASTVLLHAAPKDPGPQIGTTIPAFSLPDQRGVVRKLDDIKGPKGAVLVFIRSADW
jgi:hypothetical protein